MTDMMNTSGYSSPIRAYMDNSHRMRVSHDEDRSDPKDLCSCSGKKTILSSIY